MLLLLLSLDHHQYQYVSSHLFILRDRRSRMALFSVGIVLLFGNSTYGRGPKRGVLSLKFPGLIHATKFGQKHGSFSFQYIRAVPAKLAVF